MKRRGKSRLIKVLGVLFLFLAVTGCGGLEEKNQEADSNGFIEPVAEQGAVVVSENTGVLADAVLLAGAEVVWDSVSANGSGGEEEPEIEDTVHVIEEKEPAEGKMRRKQKNLKAMVIWLP